MLSRDDVLNAKEIYLSEHDELLIPVEDRNVGYRFTKQTLSWEVIKRWYSWKVYCKALSGEEALKVMDSWTKYNEKESSRLNEAIEFATKKHSGQFRKATTIPYILHPLEVLQILYSMRADTNVMIAGVLHDTVEDTDTTLDEIREIFGDDVADLVASNSEDKSKTWEERKQHTINELAKADLRVKMLILADKLSNIRSIALDYKNLGDELWKRFNAPKEKQSWYYSNIQDSLYEMQLNSDCAGAYWEFVGLYKDVFVKYYLDESEQTLYQVCDGIDVFALKKGNPQWIDVSSPPRGFSYDVFDKIVLMSRKDAELLEDIWNKPFWDCHNYDMQDGTYEVFCSKTRNINIKISKHTLALQCEDFEESCKNINGKEVYEFSYTLDVENTHRLFAQLRIKFGLDIELADIFKKEFGSDNGTILFENFCKKVGVQYNFFSY